MFNTLSTTGPEYSRDRAYRYMDNIRPNEQFGVGGDCMNPKCNYHFNAQDIADIERDSGWFTCPQCQQSYNLYDGATAQPGGWTRSGLTMTAMGQIGEQCIVKMGQLPNVGKVLHYYGAEIYNNPIDFIIGPYGVEVKAIHSEAQQRFKINAGKGAAISVERRVEFCRQNGLTPGLVGVRLNFYTDMADVFFRQGFVDTWIGNPKMTYEGEVNFADINPFKNPEDVPPPSELPQGDEDIPW